MSDLHADAERLCSTIKHNAAGIDLDEVRFALRRAQEVVELANAMVSETCIMTPDVDEEGYLVWDVTLSFRARSERRQNLLRFMSGEQ